MYGVFVIESLREGDFPDGSRLAEILKLSGIPTTYCWVSNRKEFKAAMNNFKLSNYRYLHLSCHADKEGIELNGDCIDNEELIEYFKNKVKGRRIFLSACQGSNLYMATVFINICKGQSIIGSPENLRFDKSALFWPSFYHVINEFDETRMNRAGLSVTLRKCVNLFKVAINYYHTTSSSPNKLMRHKIRVNKFESKKINPAISILKNQRFQTSNGQ